MARRFRAPFRRALPLLAGFVFASSGAQASEQMVDGIAAQVGTRIVLVSEVMRAVGPQEVRLRELGGSEIDVAKLRADALESLIEARLIEGVVSDFEMYASEDEVERTITAIADDNGLTLEQLYASVVFHGLTRAEYREQIKRDLERRNVVTSMVGSDINIDERDLQILYDERFGSMPDQTTMVRVRQILLTYGENAGRDAKTACKEVGVARERVRAGKDFTELAKEISEVARVEGGDIGWLELDQVASWMSEALAPLEDGDVSEPILLPFGCAILKLEQTREARRVDFETARPALHEEMWNREIEKAYRVWMEELRGRTYIDRRGYFAEAASFTQPTFGGASGGSESGPTESVLGPSPFDAP